MENNQTDDPVDLIREVKHNYSLNPFLTDLNIINNNNNNNNDEPNNKIEGKLEEIDLLASINRQNEQNQQHSNQQNSIIPDVIAMDVVQDKFIVTNSSIKINPEEEKKQSNKSVAATMATTLAPTNPFFEDIKNKAERELEIGKVFFIKIFFH